MTRWLAAMAVALTLAGAVTARADQSDTRLDPLFARLQTTTDGSEARVLEAMIWSIWSETADPASAALMRDGMLAMSSGAFADALAHFDALVERDPDFAEAWNKRATLHYLLGDYRASVADIVRTLDLEPRHFGALSGLGLIYTALNQGDAALRSFERALELNPHMPGAKANVEQLRRALEGRPT